MAVTAINLDSRIGLKLQTGTDAEGNPVIKTKNYGSIKATADNENVYAFASGIVSLQKHSLVSVERENNMELQEL